MGYKVKKWLIIGILLHIVLLLSACNADKTLKVGVEKSYRPFSYVDQGQTKGFEVELWEAIAKEAGLKYKLQPMGVGEIIKGVQNGSIDVGIAGITMNGERRKFVEFTTPYYRTGLVILTAKDNKDIMTKDDLYDKVVATKIGSTGYKFVTEVKGVKEVKAYPEIADAYKQLTAGKVDAVIFDKPNADDFARNFGVDKVKVLNTELTTEHFGIAFKQGSRVLGRVDNALRELGRNGTYERIYVKWFGKKPESVPGEQG
jgi:glutamine transport system substrate-binding protein